MLTRHTFYWLLVGAFWLIPFSESGLVWGQTKKKAKRWPTLADSKWVAKYPLVSLDETVLRQAIYDTLYQHVGKREGRLDNEGAWIRSMNTFWGIPGRARYCASSLAWGHARNGVFFPWIPLISVGRVRAYFVDPTKLVYVRGQRGNSRSMLQPRFMDWSSLYASHVEAFAERTWNPDADSYMHLGFNTGNPQGCYLVRRRKREINAIANHLTPYLKQF